jgi:peptidyl-prolyl cis-trans isomerase SurA
MAFSTSMNLFHSRRGRLVTVALLAVLAGACRSTPAAAPPVGADTFATVDGHAITKDDVDKAYRRTRDTAQTPSAEDVQMSKLSLLDDLIVQQLVLAKATTLKIEVPQAEIDTADANARKNIAPEAFQQELTQRGLTAADLREGLRRELVAQKVFAQEVTAKATVSEQELTDYFNANKAQFNLAEESYHLAQIVITPVREAQVANQAGDDASTPEAATAKVQMLMERLKGGASFRDLAIAYSEDPETAPRGGDLGLVGMTRLNQAPPQLRAAVVGKAVGAVNVASAGGAYTLVLVVAHEQAGQRDLSTPGMKDNLRASLQTRKEQLLRAAYITALRSDAVIVNHLAKRLVASNGTPLPVTP